MRVRHTNRALADLLSTAEWYDGPVDDIVEIARKDFGRDFPTLGNSYIPVASPTDTHRDQFIKIFKLSPTVAHSQASVLGVYDFLDASDLGTILVVGYRVCAAKPERGELGRATHGAFDCILAVEALSSQYRKTILIEPRELTYGFMHLL